MRVIVVGAGGQGQVVADILLNTVGSITVVGFVDDDASLSDRVFLGLSVLGTMARLRDLPHDGIVIAIGDNRRRRQICEAASLAGENLISAVHPSAQIGRDVTIARGAMISAGAVVSTGSRIEMGVIINTSATVDHHSHVGVCAHIAPGAHMGGEVHVGDEALIGIGAVVLPRVTVGRRSVVGGGAVAIADVPDETTVVGVPARALTRARA
jgi:sugar O-acyltransferase (sialic acid O-acetyltransferase NeuD family)